METILLVCLCGFSLTYSTNLCNMYNSPLALAITHNVKDVLLTTISMICFERSLYS